MIKYKSKPLNKVMLLSKNIALNNKNTLNYYYEKISNIQSTFLFNLLKY